MGDGDGGGHVVVGGEGRGIAEFEPKFQPGHMNCMTLVDILINLYDLLAKLHIEHK